MGNFLRSTPTAGLEVLFGMPPLDLHIKGLARMVAARLNTGTSGWDGIGEGQKRGHLFLLDSHLTQPTDRIPATLLWNNVQATVGADNGLCAYTDGSSNQHGEAGYGVVLVEGGVLLDTLSGGLGDSSPFQAEVIAIEAAVRALDVRTNIKIITDCKSAVQAISNLVADSGVVLRCKQALNCLLYTSPSPRDRG